MSRARVEHEAILSNAELELAGGRTTPRVVRLGDTIRRPLSSGFPLVHDLLHYATADCALRGAGEVVCHGDASPCNCVFVDGVPRAFIDFDAAHSGSRASFRRTIPRMEADPVELVVQAQVRLSAKLNDPPGNREWARACLAWTRRHRARMQAGATP